MLISHDYKFIFIHIYKVAGTSVIHTLQGVSIKNPPPLKGHSTATEIKNVLPKSVWDNYFKFCFVRNPWDWQVSLYHYILDHKNHWAHKKVSVCKNFNDYILSGTFKIGHPSQNRFFLDKNDNIIVDFIGKFENLEKDFSFICKKISLNIKLPYLNRSSRDNKGYRAFYTPKSKEIIKKFLKKDISLFNYKF